MPVRIQIVDDNATLLRSISRNLSAFEEVDIVCTAHDGHHAISQAEAHQPEVILMDIEMPGMDGIEATALLRVRLPAVKVLMLTVFDREDKIFDAIKAGASGYLLKDERPSRIVQAIEEILDGGAPMSPGIALKTLNMLRQQTIVVSNQTLNLKTIRPPEAFSLSAREIGILELVVDGLTPQQIGDKLFISAKTVRKHIENIYEKLHIHSRIDAVKLAGLNQWFK